MPLYLTLLRGPRADLATPVVASSDPVVIAAVLEALRQLVDHPDGERQDAVADPDLRVLPPWQESDGGHL